MDIYYSVSSANSPLTVYVAISADGGTTWNVPVFSVQGAVGPGVTPGNNRYIQWNAGTDWPGQFSSQCIAPHHRRRRHRPVRPQWHGLYPRRPVPNGRHFQWRERRRTSGSSVYISALFMDQFDVTRELWLNVYTWATANGYQFDNAGSLYWRKQPGADRQLV